MPTYSYACTECSNRFDVVQAFTDDALTTCEDCNGRLRKIFGKVGVVFKGSGFYRNDSREAGKSGKSTSNGSSNGSSAASSSTSGDSGSSSGDSGTKSADSGTKSSDSAKASTTSSAPATTSA
ncbi:FmdB family zinc ribbon protein [Mycolicibacter heraklionensis]|uniref:FmdB family zinc ribbon protein n=1 Tax=Mycolicibacter heraklionensis TaxID=512402 RepID=UPI0007E9CE6D|nr:FmdB family zinc ribbon protein [Mycolicibacter heraklionensis]OBG31980.1 FmdB family transcriptional regulator [Mycolicibacter heraklionensis]OBJ34299.1 FmdB family transcriptional regulator [Mycolicibacter heraklionensis]